MSNKMVNKCAVSYCPTGKGSSTDPTNDEKCTSTFRFPLDDVELNNKWIYFVGRKDWSPTKYSTICEHHFDAQYIKKCPQRNKLNYHLRPVPTIHTCKSGEIPESVLRVPTLPRPPPKDRTTIPDEKVAFRDNDKISSLDDLNEKHCPPGFTFRRHRDKVVYFNLQMDYVTSTPMVFESIVIDQNLHVALTYKGNHVPLPSFFRDNRCVLNKFSVLENFPAHIRRKDARLILHWPR